MRPPMGISERRSRDEVTMGLPATTATWHSSSSSNNNDNDEDEHDDDDNPTANAAASVTLQEHIPAS